MGGSSFLERLKRLEQGISGIESRLRQIESRLMIEPRSQHAGTAEPSSAGPPPLPGAATAPFPGAAPVGNWEDIVRPPPLVGVEPFAATAAAEAIKGEPAEPSPFDADIPYAGEVDDPGFRNVASGVGDVPPPSAGPIAYDRVPPPRPVPPERATLEDRIGVTWAGWFGAIVLVIGVGLGIKFAYDQGWLNGIPGIVKLLLLGSVGVALLGAGEFVWRRVHRVSAAGLFASGVAVLYLVGYAGYGWYDVYTQEIAFVTMTLVTVIGILVAARTDLVAVAVLSLIGGHLTPVLVASRSASPASLLSYLSLLVVLALALCFWQARPKWWTLRSLSMAGSVLWSMILSYDAGAGTTIATFTAVFLVLYQAELIATAVRLDALVAAGRRSAGADPRPAAAFSLVATALCVLLLWIALRPQGDPAVAMWVTMTAGLTAAAGFVLRATVRPSLGALSISLRTQAAALVVLAVHLWFAGAAIVFACLLLAVAFAMLARQLSLKLSAGAAIVVWLLAVRAWAAWAGLSVDGFDWHNSSAPSTWLTLFEVAIPAGLGYGVFVVAAAHVIAVLIQPVLQTNTAAAAGFSEDNFGARGLSVPDRTRNEEELSFAPIALHAMAALAWIVASAVFLPRLPATVSLLLYAWVLLAASRRQTLAVLGYAAVGVLLVACWKWALLDLAERRSLSAVTRPFINAYMATGGLLAGSLVAAGWVLRQRVERFLAGLADRTRLYFSALLCSAVLIVTIGLTFETVASLDGASGGWPSRVADVACDVLWTVAAVVVLLTDRLWIRPVSAGVARVATAGVWIAWLKLFLADLILRRIFAGAAPVEPLLNGFTLAVLVSIGGLVATAALAPTPDLQTTARQLIALSILLHGSIEIDRFATNQSGNPFITRQAGWSVWWSVFAVGSLVVGFAMRNKPLRMAALGLLAATLLKVVLIDLSEANTGWRVLSFCVLGLLLLGTSVLYGRFGLKERDANASP